MKKLLSIILSIALLITLPMAAMAEISDSRTIRVGVVSDFPPFEYYNDDGKLYGFDIDLMIYIAELTGRKVEFVDMTFPELLPAVVNGEVDCAISVITVTPERSKIVDFTDPYITCKIRYVVEDGVEESIESYSIAVKKENSLYGELNDAVKEAVSNGGVEHFADKYEIERAVYEDYGYEMTVLPVSEPVEPPSDWAEEYIYTAKSIGVTELHKIYDYTNPITREEFCELIYNYVTGLGINVEDASEEFVDTDNIKITVLSTMGIINGKSQSEFAPNDYLTREEAATILHRMANKTIPVPVTELFFEFDDLLDVSDWAMDSLQVICNMGVMNGVGDNKFAPGDTYTTEQAIATIVRMYQVQVSDQENIIGGADTYTEIYVGTENTHTVKFADKDGNIIITGEDIAGCEAKLQQNEWVLEFDFSDQGRKKFREATKKISEYGDYIAVVVDEQVISTPSVMTEFDSETIIITGDFTEETVKTFENIINEAIK